MSVLKKQVKWLNRLEELFMGYTLLTLALVATVQVFLRAVAGISFDWVDEGSRYMTVLITFVGVGVGVRYGAHFSMDAAIQYVPNRIKHLLRCLANLVSAITMGVVFYYSWVQIGKLAKFGATTPSLQIPMYIPYLPIGVFSIIAAVRFFLEAVDNTTGAVANRPFIHKKGAA